MSTTIGGVRIVDMPDLGVITDDSSVVGEHAGSGRFAATAFRTYVAGLGTTNIGRNLIHNPLFNVAQRGAGPFTTSVFTLDRWFIAAALDTFNIVQGALADANRTQIGDEAATFSLSNSFTGNAGATAYNQLIQKLEDVRRLAGKTVTLSFWAVANSAGLKLGANLLQFFGSGGSPSVAVGVNGQSVTLTTGFVRYNLTFSVPSVIGKTLGSNSDHSTWCQFWFSAGANSAGGSGGIGVQSGQIQIWGVQLEIGSVATPLEKLDPAYDLANCQRFFQVGYWNMAGSAAVGINEIATIALPVQMRAAPTMNFDVSGASVNVNTVTVTANTNAYIRVNVLTTTTAGYVGSGGFIASADL